MVRRLSFFLFFTFTLNNQSLVAEAPACKVAEQALQEASLIRGLRIKKAVPCLIENKDEVKKYLLETVEKQLPPAKLKGEEFVYKTLGLLPNDFDYGKGIVELYLGQIGGYYDPDEHHFVMAGWLPPNMQTTIAVHEQTHALQDQYYNMKKFIDPSRNNGDVILARSALVEGDANAVMYDYERRRSGGIPLAAETNVEGLIFANALGAASAMTSSGPVPKSLQSMLVFPYNSGLRFVHSIIKAKGYHGVDQIFKNPPRSTEEILWPEKYWQVDPDFIEYSEVQLREEGVPSEYRKAYEDTMGEFGIAAIFSMYSVERAEIDRASKGWGGDRVMLFQSENDDDDKMIIWKTNWDTLQDSEEFASAYKKLLAERFPEIKGASTIEWNSTQTAGSVKFIKDRRSVTVLFRFGN